MTRLAAERAFLPSGRGGTVVNVTLSPHHGLAGMTHSSAARAAVEGYTRAQAEVWAEHGISVIAVAAGHFDTASLRKYPEAGLARGRAHRPAAAAGARGGARLARRALLLAAGRRALRLRRHARRRARQLVRPLAPRALAGGEGRSPSRNAARSRPVRSYDPVVRCGRSVVVAQKPSKLLGRVRFPSPACETATGSGAVW